MIWKQYTQTLFQRNQMNSQLWTEFSKKLLRKFTTFIDIIFNLNPIVTILVYKTNEKELVFEVLL